MRSPRWPCACLFVGLCLCLALLTTSPPSPVTLTKFNGYFYEYYTVRRDFNSVFYNYLHSVIKTWQKGAFARLKQQ